MINTDGQPGQEVTDRFPELSLHNAAPAVLPSFSWPWALAVMFVLTMLMFGDVLLTGGATILSSAHTDIATQFLYWRDFGFRELRQGNLALWNPHLFSGAPFFGGFQSALLYPLNFPYLLLPVGAAINIGIALHVLLLGFFMYLWASRRGLHPLAALLTGMIAMFCGPHFLHIFAGHLPNLCTMTWVPLIFLAVDGLLERPTLGWGLLGSFAVSMQVLAGHPQYVYYTGLCVLIYATLSILGTSCPGDAPYAGGGRCDATTPERIGRNSKARQIKELFFSIADRKWSMLAVLAIFAAGAALSAVQILTGLDAARESVRAGGVPFSFAAMFSFPPENFLTLIAPYFFGDLINNPYWGRAYLWEMNLFIGINGLLLAGYGFLKGGRTAWTLAAVLFVIFVLALGSHTPLFHILFDYLPGFDKFRGTAKFTFFATLLMIILAGTGLDKLMSAARKGTPAAATPPAPPAVTANTLDTPTDTTTEPLTHAATEPQAAASTRPPTGTGMKKPLPKSMIELPLTSRGFFFILSAALVTAAFALWLNLVATEALPPEIWRNFLAMIARSRESYLDTRLFAHREFILHTAFFASQWLLIAALTLAVTAWLWRLTRKHPQAAVFGIVLLAVLEVFLFARMTRETFNPADRKIPGLEAFARSVKQEERILNLWQPNSALSLGTHDIWGYDPGVPRRYAELVAFTQGIDHHKASQYVNFRQYHPLLKMLRLRYVFAPGREKLEIRKFPDAMERVHLVSDWQEAASPSEGLAVMGKPDFDPLKTVVLEKSPPGAKKACPEPGTAHIVASSSDEFTVEAKLNCPAILLITDNYATGWQAEADRDNDAHRYAIMRANHTLMAVPLAGGIHLFRVFYRPAAFVAGQVISILAWIIYALIFLYWRQWRPVFPKFPRS